MFCANCGTKQNEGEKFCPNCGTRFEEPKMIKEEVSNDASKQPTPLKEKVTLSKEKDGKVEKSKPTIKENKETVVHNSHLKEQALENDIVIANRIIAIKDIAEKELGGGDKNNGNSLGNSIKNDSTNDFSTISNTIQCEPIYSNKCENELKVKPNKLEPIVKEYESLFEKIKNKLHLIDIDRSMQTGLVSDRISVSTKVFYESKKKYHDESSLVYIETLSMYKFKVYITYDAKTINDIKQKIKKYNNLVVGYGYNSIQFNEKKLFVEGRFIKTKNSANIGFFKSLLISEDDINREKMFERLFKEIYNLCESIKV